MRQTRSSGILLHPTSLPGRFGIGDLGPATETFLDFLAETGQRWWQILPIGPTGYGNSPYQSYSSFAGSRLLVSPERLAEEGLLTQAELDEYPALSDDRVDFDAVDAAKEQLFRHAFARFNVEQAAFVDFVAANSYWLDDYSLFMALKGAAGGQAWYDWNHDLVSRQPEALARARVELAESVRYYQFVQFAFDQQWKALRAACEARNIGLIGDVPIFVAHDSSDVWARPELFYLDERGQPTVIAGVPPDYFSETGQLWGNPLYRWEVHYQERFAWWIARMKAILERVDIARLDHFRGFEAYWEVPAGAETAIGGRWALGPGIAFLDALKTALGGLPIIAEDLGEITAEVRSLRDRFELPGMRILQFAFEGDPKTQENLPHNYPPHCVAYTGTHDNDTTVGWFKRIQAETTQNRHHAIAERVFAMRYLGTSTEAVEIHWEMIRLASSSVADTVILPLQDVLGLDSPARMNMPGRGVGNWGWRVPAGLPDNNAKIRLANTTAVYGRWNGAPPRAFTFPIPPADDPSVPRASSGG